MFFSMNHLSIVTLKSLFKILVKDKDAKRKNHKTCWLARSSGKNILPETFSKTILLFEN